MQMKTAADAPADTDTITDRLTTFDRCDACTVAQAWVEVTTPAGPLLLCAHHFAVHEASLASAGYPVHDERHRINAAPSPSANAA